MFRSRRERERILKRLLELQYSEGDEHRRSIAAWELELLNLPDTPAVRAAYSHGFRTCANELYRDIEAGGY